MAEKKKKKVKKVNKTKKTGSQKNILKFKKPKKAKQVKKIRPPRYDFSRILPDIKLPEIHFNWTKKHTKLALIYTALVMIIAVILLYVASKYTIKTVLVEGSTHYSNEEIYDMILGDGVLSHNSLYLSAKYTNKEIRDIPFVETLNVKITSPTSVKITVYEKAMAGFVEYMGQFIYFDKDGTVIESSDMKTSGIPQIIGMKFDHFVLYEPLPVSDPDIFGQILDVSQLMEKYGIDVDKIYFDDDYNLTLYFCDARVKLGGFENIDEKIIRLKAILPELEGKKGVLRMENYTKDSAFSTFEVDEQ